MTDFVLDASVTMRWVLETRKRSDQEYAWTVIDQLERSEALVPALWYLEVTHVLLRSERQNLIPQSESERFISQLEALPIRTDHETWSQAFSRIVGIGRSCRLSSYDAAYLELSVRTGLPIASLDQPMRRAARLLDVPLYLA